MADLEDYQMPPGYGETVGAVRELGPADEVKFWQDKCAELEAEVARLRQGVESYRAGNYESPRSHRPRQCPHGLSYWQECDACNDAALAAILKPAGNLSEPHE